MVTLNTCYTLQFYTGLQADTKPLGVPNGSLFLEMDTGKLFRFDAQNQTWIDQANPTPSGGNDMFIVTITQDGDDYSADKTLEEITAALEDGQIPIAFLSTQALYYSLRVPIPGMEAVVFSSIPSVNASTGVSITTVTVSAESVTYDTATYVAGVS